MLYPFYVFNFVFIASLSLSDNYKCPHLCVSTHTHTHTHTHENDPQERETYFLCTDCDARFSGTSQLRVHTFKRHTPNENAFLCSQCRARFLSEKQLEQHIQTHTGEKHFRCSDCNAAFRLSWQSKHHTVVHSHEKPFSCRVFFFFEKCQQLASPCKSSSQGIKTNLL